MSRSVAIPFSGARAQGAVLVDAEDAEWAARYRWYRSATEPVYAFRSEWNGRTMTTVYMHREIASPPTGYQVHHANENTLDNRRSNLRVVTPGENQRAKTKAHSNSKTGVRGVTRSRGGQYIAYVYENGRRVTLGWFKSVEDAGRAAAQKRAEMLAHLTPVRARAGSLT